MTPIHSRTLALRLNWDILGTFMGTYKVYSRYIRIPGLRAHNYWGPMASMLEPHPRSIGTVKKPPRRLVGTPSAERDLGFKVWVHLGVQVCL